MFDSEQKYCVFIYDLDDDDADAGRIIAGFLLSMRQAILLHTDLRIE